jgi:thymidylate synthase
MSRFENDYKNLLRTILAGGVEEKNRTGVNTLVCFAESLKIDVSEGFPILTGKKIFFDKAKAEFDWIIQGLTSLKYLNEKGVTWWDKYAKDGHVVKSYGHQLRNYMGRFDQLGYVITEIRSKSRRAHITMWNPCDLKDQELPCCYTGMTFVVVGDKLNLNIDFRSSDVFLGLPYDIIFGALMIHSIAEVTKLQVGYLNLNLNNAHIYVNHIEPIKKYLGMNVYPLPSLVDFEVHNYKHGEFIKAELNGN